MIYITNIYIYILWRLISCQNQLKKKNIKSFDSERILSSSSRYYFFYKMKSNVNYGKKVRSTTRLVRDSQVPDIEPGTIQQQGRKEIDTISISF